VVRRNKGEGTIYQLEGRRGYRAQVTLKDGRKLTKQFRTSTLASSWIREQHLRDAQGLHSEGSAMTLHEWMEGYLRERELTRRPSTMATDRVHWTKHFGAITEFRLRDLDALTIRRWLEALQRSFVTEQRPDGQPHTLRICYSLLRSALAAAVERDVLEVSPMAKVKRPQVPRPQPKYLRPDELKLVLDHLYETGDPREMAVQLMVRLGLRRGEALGLTWQDVDLDTGRVTVALQLQRIPDPEGPSRMVLARVPLKTAASRRVIRASGTLLDRLRTLRRSAGAAPSDFVVTLGNGPVDPSLMTRWLSNRTKEIGIRCSPHRLRHTAATLMLNRVGSITTVSTFLGHTDLKTTSVYARVLDDTSETASAALGEVVDEL
jgi:integrase